MLAAAITLVPFGVLLWLAFHFVGAKYLDYPIAEVVFVLGPRALKEGRTKHPAGTTRGNPGRVEKLGLA